VRNIKMNYKVYGCSSDKALVDSKGWFQLLTFWSRGFKPLYYRAASQTLNSGVNSLVVSAVMRSPLDCM
jgi:hypothetical protein